MKHLLQNDKLEYHPNTQQISVNSARNANTKQLNLLNMNMSTKSKQ